MSKKKGRAPYNVDTRHETAGRLILWTDGSCWPNPGPGGWGWWCETTKDEGRGGESDTTNNRMELLAILEALRATAGPAIVRTDSQLCVLCAIGAWKRKTNIDMWAELDRLMAGREVLFEWWRGHCGTAGNEYADQLAAIGQAEAARAPLTSDLSP